MNRFIKLIRPNQTGTLLTYSAAIFGLLIGGFYGGFIPSLWLFVVFLLGAFFTRSAGCIINDVFDRNFDIHVQRTKFRPVATGEISVFLAICIATAFLILSVLILFLLPLVAIPLFVIAGILITIYPLFKRFTYFPQVALGLAIAFGFLASFFTVTLFFNFAIILPFISIVIWTIIYDTIYAMQDIKDDLKLGLKSTSIKFGNKYKQILYFLAIIYLFLLLIFWHISGLQYIIFPILSFALLTFLIYKSDDANYAKMFILTPIPCFILGFGVLLNLL